MGLEDLGYNESVEKLRAEENIKDFDIGRVIAEHKKRYTVKTEKGEFDAEITGNMRFNANDREDYPAVGDWVAVSTFDSDFAVIHDVVAESERAHELVSEVNQYSSVFPESEL